MNYFASQESRFSLMAAAALVRVDVVP